MKQIDIKGLQPGFMELMEYAVRHLERLLHTSNPKLSTFCELNNIIIFRVGYKDSQFKLEIKFKQEAGQLAPLGDKERLWLERYIKAELKLKDINQYPQGGGYVIYTISQIEKRYDEIDPDYFSREYWWDNGAWFTNEV